MWPHSKNLSIFSSDIRLFSPWVTTNSYRVWYPLEHVLFLNVLTEKQPSPSTKPTIHHGSSLSCWFAAILALSLCVITHIVAGYTQLFQHIAQFSSLVFLCTRVKEVWLPHYGNDFYILNHRTVHFCWYINLNWYSLLFLIKSLRRRKGRTISCPDVHRDVDI